MSAVHDYAIDRDNAFVAFVGDGDFSHIDALCDKWGLVRLPHTDTGAAAVYKAVQECTGISDNVKATAFAKCVEIGFMPWLDFKGGDAE